MKENEQTDVEEQTEEVTDGGHAVGDIISTEAGESILVSLNTDIGGLETGPIILNIEKVNGVSLEVSNDMKDFFDGKDELEYIQVDMKVENSSEDNIIFYASQAVLTTNTGEQLDPDMLLSDHIDGDYLGTVTKSGTSFYILEKSTADEVDSIKLFFSAPVDENYDDIGEKLEIEIDLHK